MSKYFSHHTNRENPLTPFKIPAYDPETHSYPMTWSDLVIMVEGINEDKRKGRQRRLSDLKRHWQISVNKVSVR